MNDIDEKARALFERSVQQLDESSVRRLRLARRSTLASAPAPRSRAWPAVAAAVALLALGLGWWLPQHRPAAVPVSGTAMPAPALAEEPLPAADDEDADLYAWLGEAPVAADDAEQRL